MLKYVRKKKTLWHIVKWGGNNIITACGKMILKAEATISEQKPKHSFCYSCQDTWLKRNHDLAEADGARQQNQSR